MPSPDKVERALSPGVLYEIMQFVEAASILTNQTLFGRFIINAALESMLSHARSLDDFFRSESTNSDDVQASHFGLTGRRILPDELRKRINRDLAHLTYTSVDRQDKGWEFIPFKPLAQACGVRDLSPGR